MTGARIQVLKDTTANPGPLGLMAFGMTTILLNLHNAGAYELNAMLLAMGMLYGGLAQVFASWMEWKKGNTFAMVAFGSYGFFWMLLVTLILIPRITFIAGASELESSGAAMGWFFLVWALFSCGMFVATLRLAPSLQVVFFAVTVLFGLLAVYELSGSALLGRIAGWEGILAGASAMYVAVAQIWSAVAGEAPSSSAEPAPPTRFGLENEDPGA